MNIERPTSNFELLKKRALEMIGVVWLVLVAAQYVSGYFLGVDMGFSYAYVGMFAITIIAAIFHLLRRFLWSVPY